MLILAGGRAMPDGREEPKAQALVGKRARVGRVRRAHAQKVWPLRARRRRELWYVSSRLRVHKELNLLRRKGSFGPFWCSKGAWTTDDLEVQYMYGILEKSSPEITRKFLCPCRSRAVGFAGENENAKVNMVEFPLCVHAKFAKNSAKRPLLGRRPTKSLALSQ